MAPLAWKLPLRGDTSHLTKNAGLIQAMHYALARVSHKYAE